MGGVSTPPTIASGAQYNHFSALTSLNVLGSTETRTYNVLGQLTRITGLGIDLEYTFSATQNDGKITSQKNWVSGEEVAYQYDSLERLISAVTTGPQWGLSFGYDGFGNRLTQTVTKGTAPSNSVLVDGTTNRINSAGFVYDNNGNMTNMPTNTATLTYDASNRMTQYSGTNIQEAYAYAPDNKRIWRSNTMRGCEVPNTPGQSQPTPTQGDAFVFYGANGLKLGVYCLKDAGGTRFQIASEQNLYFGWTFVARVGLLRNILSVATDRLDSTQSQGGHFPYGEFKSVSASGQDKEEFGTYTRDRSGLDYARQRTYVPALGRFTSSDPYEASASALEPQSWNRYPYVTNDPVNLHDPSGLFGQAPDCPVGTIKQAVGDNYKCVSVGGGGGGGGGGYPNGPVLEQEPNDITPYLQSGTGSSSESWKRWIRGIAQNAVESLQENCKKLLSGMTLSLPEKVAGPQDSALNGLQQAASSTTFFSLGLGSTDFILTLSQATGLPSQSNPTLMEYWLRSGGALALTVSYGPTGAARSLPFVILGPTLDQAPYDQAYFSGIVLHELLHVTFASMTGPTSHLQIAQALGIDTAYMSDFDASNAMDKFFKDGCKK